MIGDLLKQSGLATLPGGLRGLSFGLADAFDILLVSLMVFVALKLLYQTRSLPVIFGISTVFLLYGLATIFSLSLTRGILQSFLSVFIILLVIVFQNEFRRFLTYFNLTPRISRKNLPSESVVQIISGTVRQLSIKNTGALLVFPGREAIEQYLTAGYDLDGEISEPLLLSIFDEATPGHDGAVILEGSRLKKFGVHLPLASDPQTTRGFGTRHRAGLGLSERSDSLVIIVSEEKGSISIAQNGRLTQLSNPGKLEEIIRRFYEEKFPHRNTTYLIRLGFQNVALVLGTVLIASGIWVYSSQSSPLAQKNFVVALEFQNVPTDLVVNEAVPEEVILTLEARGDNFQSLKTEEIRVPIDLSNARRGWRQFLIDREKIKLPFDFTLVKVDPERVSLQIIQKEGQAVTAPRPRP